MTTYNSYAAAKMANPESEIYKLSNGFIATDNPQGPSVHKCNPADHCQTVEKFLAGGHKFVEGDLIIGFGGQVCTVYMDSIDSWNYDDSDESDDRRYILRAAALEEKPKQVVSPYYSEKLIQCEIGTAVEEKPKRTMGSAAIETLQRLGYEWKGGELWKPPVGVAPSYLKPKRMRVEYVKVHNSVAIKAVMEGSIDYWCELNGSYSNLTMDSSLQEFCCAVERIEVEVSERDEFVEAYRRLRERFVVQHEYENFDEFMADSGEFKLVEGE